jgi:hypothetical protein
MHALCAHVCARVSVCACLSECVWARWILMVKRVHNQVRNALFPAPLVIAGPSGASVTLPPSHHSLSLSAFSSVSTSSLFLVDSRCHLLVFSLPLPPSPSLSLPLPHFLLFLPPSLLPPSLPHIDSLCHSLAFSLPVPPLRRNGFKGWFH